MRLGALLLWSSFPPDKHLVSSGWKGLEKSGIFEVRKRFVFPDLIPSFLVCMDILFPQCVSAISSFHAGFIKTCPSIRLSVNHLSISPSAYTSFHPTTCRNKLVSACRIFILTTMKISNEFMQSFCICTLN